MSLCVSRVRPRKRRFPGYDARSRVLLLTSEEGDRVPGRDPRLLMLGGAALGPRAVWPGPPHPVGRPEQPGGL